MNSVCRTEMLDKELVIDTALGERVLGSDVLVPSCRYSGGTGSKRGERSDDRKVGITL